MKYKVYGIVSFCLALVVITTSLWFSKSEEKERYHQHLMAEPKAACSHSADLFCTHLPLIQIDTGGVSIPGKVYNGDYLNPTVTEDGKTEVSKVYNGEELGFFVGANMKLNIPQKPVLYTQFVWNMDPYKGFGDGQENINYDGYTLGDGAGDYAGAGAFRVALRWDF